MLPNGWNRPVGTALYPPAPFGPNTRRVPSADPPTATGRGTNVGGGGGGGGETGASVPPPPADVFPAKLASPPYTAVNVYDPAPRPLTGRTIDPDPAGSAPTGVPFARKVTV